MRRITLLSLAAALLAVVGCAENGETTSDTAEPTGEAPVVSAEHDHGHGLHGWWCTEHGVPEEECARCDSSLVAQFKAEGDWCQEHKRPESQCFICNPDAKEKFAARFEAKYGEKPPEPAE